MTLLKIGVYNLVERDTIVTRSNVIGFAEEMNMSFIENVKLELREMHKIGIIGSESKLQRVVKVLEKHASTSMRTVA
jgi:hypothetical protein